MGIAIGYRLAFAPTLIMLLFYLYLSEKLSLKEILLFGSILTLILVLLFIPFIWNHWADFQINHPFIKQAKITKSQTALILTIGIFFAFNIKNQLDVYFYTVVLVFIAVLLGCIQYTRYTTLLYNAMTFPLIIKYLYLNEVVPLLVCPQTIKLERKT